MKGVLTGVLLTALCAACGPRPSRTFTLGLLAPVGPRDAESAGRLGLTVVDRAPSGAAMESAAAGEKIADWNRLRFLAALAAAEGKTGIFFLLPVPPAGRALVDYPEEWQALARVARELRAVRPILEQGVETLPAVPLPPGVEGRAWDFLGRPYLLLVNASDAPVPVDAAPLARFRALFEVRADARELLVPCAGELCLAPGRVLWLEGRYR